MKLDRNATTGDTIVVVVGEDPAIVVDGYDEEAPALAKGKDGTCNCADGVVVERRSGELGEEIDPPLPLRPGDDDMVNANKSKMH